MGTYTSKEDNSNNIPDEASIPTKVQRQPQAPPNYSNLDPRGNQLAIADDNSNNFLTETTSDNVVPTVFKWEHGGKHVYITGTFNNWERQIPMHRSGNDFTYVHNLKRGKHAFKFVVDDEWRYAPDQPTIADVEGQINNFIDVSDFVPYIGDENFFVKSKDRKIAEEDYRQVIPDIDEYTKE
jgi:hypothetical protein